ncbi:putative entry exclusion protein TrbK-alt [Mesorhizobium sp.]|uniref:putative entry exclusion protein TrbK-alt n=1 Tax=Mesorhizobium sp. TaxID=1871066 RepID=UPI0025FE825C|nr:putative entry exclusion protein TrbK-alt [Mesorhizobium sp.]
MDGKLLARIGAVVFIAVAITAAVIQSARKEEQPALPVPSAPKTRQDPLREGQLRCQEIGQQAAADPQCLRVWAETRDRFLGHAPASPSSNDRR